MGANIYRNKKPLLFFLVPAFAFMVVFLHYPFVMNILNSFQNIGGLAAQGKGFLDPWYSNYTEMLHDKNLWTALKNTLILMASTVVFQVGIALVLAIMVDQITVGKKFFRVVYFFPIVISATALGLLFNLVFLRDKGMVNQFLELFGRTELIDWKDKSRALVTMLLPVMWQYVGFYFVIIVTGLNNISDDLYEVASIDGATRWQRIRYITLPLLHNVLCTCVVLAVTGALKAFDLPWIMFPKGMPLNSTWLTSTYMYYHAVESRNTDYGCAIAVLIVILGIVSAKIVNAVFKEKDY
ncbi:MAG: carbohydrate ABC transporter permease [Marvinbryantia sp.]|uniref:carbohydrate ABC transporter permease n=1 Tax=Marvinbryantia sp. TaxID=2496532 RepID=UPI0025FCA941|nr:sugar ABC transporter permease [uncultured Marvinbryantia sp.]